MCASTVCVWFGGSLLSHWGVGGILPQDGDTWGFTQGWMASDQHCGVRSSPGKQGQGCPTAHGGGIPTPSQILLPVGEEHITGAGPGLANARILIHGLLRELLNPPSRAKAAQELGRSELPVAHRCVGRSDGTHIPPAAACKAQTMLYSSLWHHQLHLCSVSPGPGQGRGGSVPAEWRQAPSPAPTSSGCSWCSVLVVSEICFSQLGLALPPWDPT